MCRSHSIGSSFLLLSLAITVSAQETAPPASSRFATANGDEVPDFQRHVVPLLGRLGCNGRACHGSFQGRGGFRLSLFGYDFKMDHAGLTGQATAEKGLRVDRSDPPESLVLLKPSLETDHEGGRRFANGSWQHHLLLRWIKAGTAGSEEPRELKRLIVQPSEVVFDGSEGTRSSKPAAAAVGAEPCMEVAPETSWGRSAVQLRVTAVWDDGFQEDVTCLCRFRTNDDSVARVDADGRVEPAGDGDTHVVAFYDNGVVAVPVMRPGSALDTEYPQLANRSQIDRLINGKLKKLRMVPSAICSDTEFLRRVSIDMTGTLPTPDEIERFLADHSERKRAKKIEQLSERPAFAAWWSNKLCDFTGCNPRQQAELGEGLAVQWYDWVYDRLRENIPYDELVRRMVLASGRSEGQTYDHYAAETSSYFRADSPASFTERETMPHYWSRRTLNKPQEKALAFAHSFLGIRLQCAQCHKHPWDQWTQHDFNQFTEFFSNVRFGVRPDSIARYRELARQVGLNVRGNEGSPVRLETLRRAQDGETIPWREVYVAERKAPTTLRLLRSRTVRLDVGDDPRQPIMDWMSDPNNPWFARSFVNRVWAGYFNVGIIDPPDDLSAANPPSNPQLLDWLARSFVEHGYDMKWLHRQIVSSDAYQRSWQPNETNRQDRRNYSRAVPRRIPAEVVYDALKQATAATDQQAVVRSDLTRRAIGHLSMRLAGTYAMHVFGKPERAVNCDCERVNAPTLLQSIFLQNDPLVEQRLEESGWIAEIASLGRGEVAIGGLIRTAYLRTVGRPPKPAELARASEHVRQSSSPAEGVRDLLWVLINTKEFILNR